MRRPSSLFAVRLRPHHIAPTATSPSIIVGARRWLASSSSGGGVQSSKTSTPSPGGEDKDNKNIDASAPQKPTRPVSTRVSLRAPAAVTGGPSSTTSAPHVSWAQPEGTHAAPSDASGAGPEATATATAEGGRGSVPRWGDGHSAVTPEAGPSSSIRPVSSDAETAAASTATDGSGVNGAPALGSDLYGTLDSGRRMDHGPIRATGLWKVSEVIDERSKTVDFRRIDDIESEIAETLEGRDDALVPVDDEAAWKHKLMFRHRFVKTPKHLTWKELGQEIECVDCTINLDDHRPEERFEIKFFFTDRKRGTRDVIWSARNDVSYSEGFTDLLAAVGSCLGRADVFRTIRFDDGNGTTRDITIRKKSRFTSDILISFRPAVSYNVYDRTEDQTKWEKDMAEGGLSTWGFHPQLMDPEYRDVEDPEGTYTITISAHALSFIMLRCIERLVERPLKDFYRPSQVARRAKQQVSEEIGFSHAVKGWLGTEDKLFTHFTPIEALQDHWLGSDAPFTLVSIINKLREMTYLKKRNPEFQSWLSVRKNDTALAIRNVGVKMLGAGASTLFVPRTHNATANFLLPKSQHRRLESRFSINAALGMPDETRRLGEFKAIMQSASRLEDSSSSAAAASSTTTAAAPTSSAAAHSPPSASPSPSAPAAAAASPASTVAAASSSSASEEGKTVKPKQ